ncbi:hypothetical protein IGI04_039715 [Brassica rapa subsp. trilocularis]|uniref:Uncharacterized protein n=1 Tax=Brassica rapa subsp. trilocularis TaxID=1813537 RepID=A0ABQ7KPC7_BRACM|nr:hypothetical protein IGI04_039715 [Brassica rapa subsp. trilocularis]
MPSLLLVPLPEAFFRSTIQTIVEWRLSLMPSEVVSVWSCGRSVLGFLVSVFVLGWVVGSCRSRASWFERIYLSVARGNRLFYSDLSCSLWSLLVSLLSWF